MPIRFSNIILLSMLLLLSPVAVIAQPPDNDTTLAAYYFEKGEFEKAEVYYEKLYKQYKSKNYFDRYFMCLFYQQRYAECETLAEKQIKRDPYDIDSKFLLAMVYEETNREKEANLI